MDFDEKLFIRALIDRPADARRYSQTFKPHWLKSAEYQPVLTKMFEFIEKHTIPPSVATLRQLFQEEDSTAYDLRYKDVLDKIEQTEYDDSLAVHTMDKVKNVSVAWSLDALIRNPDFVHCLETHDGVEIVTQIQKWLANLEGSNEDIEMSIEDAVEDLIKARGWQNNNNQIPTGIDFLDDWCGGGLKPRQLGIFVAPTGGGKSMCLTILAYKMAVLSEKRVMFISNELSMGEVTERFGSLIAQVGQREIVESPTVIRKGLDKLTKFNIKEKLHLVEVTREISTNDIEGMIARNINLYGWAPEVIIIDYMERMKPIATGLSRENTSGWFGEIAKDLIRMSKRTNTLVWTACQTNRSGYNPDVIQNITQAQGSIKHFQEASAVIAVRQRPDLESNCLKGSGRKMMEFAALKMRHFRKDDRPIYVEADFDKITITKDIHDPSEWTKSDEDDTGMKTSTGKGKNKGKKDDTP